MTTLSSLTGNYMKIKINAKVEINVSESVNKPGIDVSDFGTTTGMNESQESIFNELVASLFKQPTDKQNENVWPHAGNPLRSESSSGLPSGWHPKKGVLSPNYQEIMMDALTTTVATSLKNEEYAITVEDWNQFVENVNSKL